jgi:hypothetical protein
MTRDAAITAAAQPLADAYRTLHGIDGSSIEAAARAAWTPTGPSLTNLIDRITARRQQHAAA